jgi:hypothetical protein
MYSLDTSAILNPWWKFYPPDVFRSLWDRLDDLIEQQCLFASEEVLVELERKANEVYEWALNRQGMFVPTDAYIQSEVTSILSCYQRLVDTRRNRSGADPFVIALAAVKGYTVVTYENRGGNPDKPHIPDVCDELGIRTISFLEFVREQGWVI